MRVAVTAPLWTEPLLGHLHPDQRSTVSPGLGAPAVNDLVEGLLDRGFEVVVVTMDRPVTEEVVATGPRLRLCIGPYRPRGRARDAFRPEREYVASALERERPDVVHAHWTYEFALGALASACPTIVTIHDWAPAILRYHMHPYRVVRLLMQAETFRKGQHFTAVSPYIRDRVQRWTRRRPAVVPNGLREGAFGAASRRLNRERPLLLAINAGFGRRKNVTSLLEAFSLLRLKRPEARLLLLGAEHGEDGPAHQWAQSRGLASGVTFRGAVPKEAVQRAVAEADVLVHPSLEESFGMVLIEAMAQGLPVVGGANSGAVPWVLDSGRAGVLTDVRSPARLADSLDELLSEEDSWSEVGRRGYDRAWEHFRLSVILDQYVSLYETIR